MILTTFLACLPMLDEAYETGWATTDPLDQLDDEAAAAEDEDTCDEPSEEDEEAPTEEDDEEDGEEEVAEGDCDVSLPENGDTVVDLGAPELPLVVCGDLGEVGNDGSSYTGDIDWVQLAVGPGYLDVTLVPDDDDAVYDIWVYGLEDDAWVLVTVGLGDEGHAQAPLVAYDDAQVLLGVIGWSGPTGGWTLELAEG